MADHSPLKTALTVALVMAAAMFAIAHAPMSAGAAQAPKRFFGVHPRSIEPGDYAEMRAANVGLLRTGFTFGLVKTRPGDPYSWRVLDEIVTGTAENGIDLLPVLYGVAPWRSNGPGSIPLGSSETEWKDFLGELVDRYGPGGDFWAAHPEVPYRPIGDWQVWNEQNALANWKGKPSPREYGRLVAISAKVIGEHDPGARIVSGGVISLPKNPVALDGVDYLRKMLKSKAAANATDVIAIHPYCDTVTVVKRQIRLTREALDRAGLRRTPIWVTEIGWGSSTSDRNPQTVPPKRQAGNLRESFEMALEQRRRFRLGRMVWYQWRDGPDEICQWCSTAGLLDADGVAKPLLEVFRDLARL